MKDSVRLGSGSAYWGDVLHPAVEIVERGDLDYICFDHLSELTLAVLQRIRSKDPARGYIEDIGPWTQATLRQAREQGIRTITNAGGANPPAAAEVVARVAESFGLGDTRIGVVTGDDIFSQLGDLRAQGVKFPNLDTGEEDLDRIADRIVAANAYIGADGMLEALADDAHVVILGRCSDNALYAGPMMHEFGWDFESTDPNLLGAAVTIGHLLECAALATGAASNFWRDAVNAWNIGYPMADVRPDGTARFTKLQDSGGVINSWTLKEQLVYEVHDPRSYLMPDAIADFTTPRFHDVAPGVVEVTDMSGRRRPDTLKVCIGFEDGWIGDGMAMFSWPDAFAKAQRGEQIVREKLKADGVSVREIHFEYIGVNALGGPTAPLPDYDINEVGLRVAAKTDTRAKADAVRRVVTQLWTLGGLGSAIAPPSRPRPVVALWPTLVPREAVEISTTVRTAATAMAAR
jgi:hypothetical protein